MTAVNLPDGQTALATASGHGTLRLCDPVTSASIGDRSIPAIDPIYAIAVAPTPEGRNLLATAGEDAKVRLWEPATGQPVGTPLDVGHVGAVTSIAVLPHHDRQTLIATAGEDTTVRLWDLTDNRPFGDPMTGHTDDIFAMTTVTVDMPRPR